MKNKWKVTSNFMPGKGEMYNIYRLINENEVDHSGNREYALENYINDKNEAEYMCEVLNDCT